MNDIHAINCEITEDIRPIDLYDFIRFNPINKRNNFLCIYEQGMEVDEWMTVRDVKAGEEVTIDYRKYGRIVTIVA